MIWLGLVQTAGLVVTLVIAISALKSSERATKGANALTIATNNRQIWGQLISNPELHGVTRPTMAKDEMVRPDERRFVVEVIHHLAANYEIVRMGGMSAQAGLRQDIHDTFSLPVFKAVWEEFKVYQNQDLAELIDDCIAGIDLDKPVSRRSGPVGRSIAKMRKMA